MHGEVISPREGNPDAVVPGLMALGERPASRCTARTGLAPTRLSTSSFSAAPPALRCAELIKKDSRHPRAAKGAGDEAIARLDRFRYAYGGTPTAELRSRMQKTMQRDCAVFRTKEVLEEGVKAIRTVWDDVADIKVDRPLADLEHRPIETLEFENLISQAAVTVQGALAREELQRRPCARGLPQARRHELDEAHAVLCRLRQATWSSTSVRCTISRSRTRWLTSSRKSGCINAPKAVLLVRDAASSLSSTPSPPRN